MKAKRSLKKNFIVAGLLFIGFCCLVFISTYFYIQSSHFKSKVEIALANITGDQIEIVGQLTLVQMVPTLKLDLPAVKIQSTNPATGFVRLRVDELGVEFPTRMIVGGFQRGTVTLNLAKVSMVARTTAAPDSAEPTNSMAKIIDDFRRQYPALEVSAFIEHIDYIVRDGENLHYEFDKLTANFSADAVTVAGQHKQGNQNTDEFRIELNELTPVGLATSEQLKAQLKLSLVPYRDFKGDNTAINISSSVDVQGNQLNFTDIDFRGSGLWARGNLFVDPTTEKTKIEADIELRQFEITRYPFSGEESQPSQNLFNNDPLDLKILDQLDLDVQVYLGAVRYNNEPVVNGQLKFQVADGKFLLNSDNLTLLGGKSEFSLSAARLQNDVEIRLKLTSDDIQLDRIRVDQSNASVLERGTGDVIIAFHGEGASTADIAGSLNGYLTAAVSDAFLKRKYASLIDQGIVSWARKKISFISRKQKPETTVVKQSRGLPVDCASLRLFINDGRVEVTNGAIIELPQNTLVSSGYIDLHNEQLGFVVRTKSESIFDWSAISIIKFLEIDGSLNNPGFGLDLGTLAKQGVLSTASFIYGPMPSLVYSLAEAGLKGRENIRCIAEID